MYGIYKSHGYKDDQAEAIDQKIVNPRICAGYDIQYIMLCISGYVLYK